MSALPMAALTLPITPVKIVYELRVARIINSGIAGALASIPVDPTPAQKDARSAIFAYEDADVDRIFRQLRRQLKALRDFAEVCIAYDADTATAEVLRSDLKWAAHCEPVDGLRARVINIDDDYANTILSQMRDCFKALTRVPPALEVPRKWRFEAATQPGGAASIAFNDMLRDLVVERDSRLHLDDPTFFDRFAQPDFDWWHVQRACRNIFSFIGRRDRPDVQRLCFALRFFSEAMQDVAYRSREASTADIYTAAVDLKKATGWSGHVQVHTRDRRRRKIGPTCAECIALGVSAAPFPFVVSEGYLDHVRAHLRTLWKTITARLDA